MRLLLPLPLVLLLILNTTGVACFSVWNRKCSLRKEVSFSRSSSLAAADQASAVWEKVATCEPDERINEILVDLNSKGQRIPKGLDGTYYVNGLASCRIGKQQKREGGGEREDGRLVHPFEAHGFIKAFTFDSNKNEIRLHAKYVDTPVRKLEQLFQRPLFRGAMSSVADTRTVCGRLQNALSPTTRETANLAVRSWANRVIVTSDNAAYYGVDGKTLETRGPEFWKDDALKNQPMLAHTRVDHQRQQLACCSLRYEPVDQTTVLTFFEFDQNGTLVSQRTHRQTPAIVVHDWTMTPHYYVVPAAAAQFDISKLPDLITGKSAATDIFAIDETAPGTILLIPREKNSNNNDDASDSSSSPLPTVQAELTDGRHGVIFHMGPSYEVYDDTENSDNNDNRKNNESKLPSSLVLHPFCFDRYQFGGEMGFLGQEQRFDPTPWSESNGGPKLERWTINLPETTATTTATTTITETTATTVNGDGNDDNDVLFMAEMTGTRLNDIVSDMPTFRPDRDGGDQPSRYVYSLGAIRPKGWFPFNAIVKHDLHNTGVADIWPPEAAKFWNEHKKGGEEEEASSFSWNGGDCVRSEPLFVPRQKSSSSSAGVVVAVGEGTKNVNDDDEEDDGFLLSTTHDTTRQCTTLEVFDAKRVGAGPILQVDLGELWGWNVHSSFVPTKTKEEGPRN